MKTQIRTAILILSAVPLVAASTSFGREIRLMLVESGPAQLVPASTAIVAPMEASLVASKMIMPTVVPVTTPVIITSPIVPTPVSTGPVSGIIIYPTNPIIFPTNPLSPP